MLFSIVCVLLSGAIMLEVQAKKYAASEDRAKQVLLCHTYALARVSIPRLNVHEQGLAIYLPLHSPPHPLPPLL